ncbi:hypothetical protein ANN_26813 [Periplaneta americana]|uniref:Uncharacterized protein n=1 Tax=Periplaneta americana TaxID=6978 RepID=A0ABQ8RZ61_PERAM|nr:hypothetical protein ANN_26813 [Periplaneta americana]
MPSGMELADPTFNKTGKIDLLIGAEIFSQILRSEAWVHVNDSLSMHSTKLEWILSGRIQATAAEVISTIAVTSLLTYNRDNLEQHLQHFWELEVIPEEQEEQKQKNSHHGKGAVDVIGGQVKRMAWMPAKSGKKIQSATEFCNIVSNKNIQIIVKEVAQIEIEIDEGKKYLEKRFEHLVPIPVSHGVHYVKISQRYTSCTGKADGNAALARRLYQERYPQIGRHLYVSITVCASMENLTLLVWEGDDQDLQLQKYRRRFWRL